MLRGLRSDIKTVGMATTRSRLCRKKPKQSVWLRRFTSPRNILVQDIADILNEQGYRKKRRRKTSNSPLFTTDALRDILHTRFYTGKVQYRPTVNGQAKHKHDKQVEEHPGQHKPILSEELFEAVQEALKVRAQGSHAYQKAYRIHFLSTIAECDLCGRNLRAQGTRTGRYYRETSNKRGFPCVNGGMRANADVMERQIGGATLTLHKISRASIPTIDKKGSATQDGAISTQTLPLSS